MSHCTRILVVAPYYPPAFRGGGPIRTLSAMVAAHGGRHEFRVLTRDGDWGTTQRLGVVSDRWVRQGNAGVWYRSPGLVGLLRALAQARHLRPDVLYLNSVFATTDSLLPLLAHRIGLLPAGQVLLAPRGEFGAGALGLKSGRKRLLLRLSRAVGLHRGIVWHASTQREAGDVRRAAPQVGSPRVVVAENESPLPEQALRGCSAPAGPLRVVFLSRISPKKGLHVLLQALPHVTTPVCLDVHGSTDDPGYLRECERLAETARDAGHDVRFAGPLAPQEVVGAFARHDVFAFPTANENFGHAIVESLCAACPVLLPDTTPWTHVARAVAGVVESHDPLHWARALQLLADESPAARLARSVAAADAYDRWRGERDDSSVFDRL